MNKFIFLPVLIFFISGVSIFAQTIEPEVFIRTKETKKIELPEANRNFEKINYELPVIDPKPQEYQDKEVEISLPKITTKMKIVHVTPEPLAKLYGNYVKAGFGNYTTPYLEAFFNNKRSEKYLYGIHLKHFSSKNGPVDFSGLSQNRGEAYAKYLSKNFTFSSGLSYSRDRYNFYGFNENSLIDRDTIKQIFNTVSLNVGIKNFRKDSKFNYDAGYAYFNFRNRFKEKEDEHLTNLSASYKLDDEMRIAADALLSISKRTDTSEINRSFFLIKPALIYKFGNYTLTAGINAAYNNDTAASGGFHLYPRINVDMVVKENLLTVFGGLDGEIQKNTLRSFVSENPFLQANVPLFHSNKSMELYAGAKGNLVGLNYKARISYANYRNLYFFNNSLTDSSQFTVLYDPKNTTVLNLGADLSYDVAETFRLGLNTNFYNYNMGSLEKPFHRPGFTTSFLATYNFYKKIYFNMDIYYISGLTGKNYISGEVVDLKGIFDVNLKADYKFSNVFLAFLEVNNILSKKYQRFLYYPVKGINVLGGISYSF